MRNRKLRVPVGKISSSPSKFYVSRDVQLAHIGHIIPLYNTVLKSYIMCVVLLCLASYSSTGSLQQPQRHRCSGTMRKARVEESFWFCHSYHCLSQGLGTHVLGLVEVAEVAAEWLTTWFWSSSRRRATQSPNEQTPGNEAPTIQFLLDQFLKKFPTQEFYDLYKFRNKILISTAV